MIGVFDSGSGGLTVLKTLVEALPDRRFVYFGDHAHAPYGDRDPDDIYRLTIASLEQLFARGCPLVIMACNTAVAAGLRRLQTEWLPFHHPGKRVIGVVAPLVEAVTGVPWAEESRAGASRGEGRTVAVFATHRTVQSEAFVREIGKRAPEIVVVQQACLVLVKLIEDGAAPEVLRREVRRYARALMTKLEGIPPDSVILGCTHYQLIAAMFAEALPQGVHILSQPEITAKSLAAYLTRHPEFTYAGPPGVDFYTTGRPEHVSAVAARFYGEAMVFKHAAIQESVTPEARADA